jgi:hypothetical protein
VYPEGSIGGARREGGGESLTGICDSAGVLQHDAAEVKSAYLPDSSLLLFLTRHHVWRYAEFSTNYYRVASPSLMTVLTTIRLKINKELIRFPWNYAVES